VGLALGTALALGAASAAEPDLAGLAKRAGTECKAGKLDAAAATLDSLVDALDARFGPGHDVTKLVAAKLAGVERARGRQAEAARLDARSGGEKRGSPDKAFERALKKLRACPTSVGKPEQAEVAGPTVRERIKLAKHQYNRGKHRDALLNAKDALREVGPSTPPADLVELHQTLALANDQLGSTESARKHARAAERYARSMKDVEVAVQMALLLAKLGDLDSASQALDAAASSARNARHRAEIAEARGDVALRLGSPHTALEQLDVALAGHRSAFGAKDPATAAVHHRLGDAHRVAGEFPEAKSAYETALAIRKEKLGASHTETAMTLNALGVLYGGLGDWQQADVSFARALGKLEPKLGRSHPETLTVRTNRALARWSAQKSDEAARGYAGVLASLEKSLGAEHPSVAAATRNLADMEFELGRTAQADALLDKALAAQTRSLGAEHPDLAPTRLRRAELLAHRGELAEAAAEIDRTLAALLAARGAEHPTTVHARALRARLAAAQGDDATALRTATENSTALASYTRHTFGAISDRQRALLAENANEVIGSLLSVQKGPARELFVALLPHRDSVLRSIVATRSQGSGTLEELRRRYMAAMLGEGAEAKQRSRELAARIDALQAGSSSGSSPESDPAAVLARACQHLPKDAALVKFVAFERTPRGATLERVASHAALVVRGGDCTVERVALADGDAIERAAETFAAAMREQRSDHAESRAELSELLLTPLRESLAGTSRWLVIPDGALWGVPIGVLPDPEAPDRYLFERVTLGYLTSTFELAETRRGTRVDAASLKALLLGDPTFGSGERGGPVVVTDTGPCQLPPFSPLPGTRLEVEEVGTFVGKATTLTGAKAARKDLEAALGSKPWLLHLATHAYFAGSGCREEKPATAAWAPGATPVAPNPLLLSGVVLAGANEPARVGGGGQPGILTAFEVAGLDLGSAGLVVLSACDTGTGLKKRGQEVQGLRWGFRSAGARALVTSLWLSNDLATRRLMRDFYQHLVSEELEDDVFRGPEALRRAQLAQVESERLVGLKRPLTWANFVFSGVL